MAGTRRRGKELEDALLEATWAELTKTGYHELTLEAVAARAGTSRPVIHRRWPDKQQLVAAALTREIGTLWPKAPDTGSLRKDLFGLLSLLNDISPQVMAIFSVQFADYFQASGDTPGRLQEAFYGGPPPEVAAIYQRAIARGDMDAERMTPLTTALPVTLLRQEVLAHRCPASDDILRQIVDDIVLPVLTR